MVWTQPDKHHLLYSHSTILPDPIARWYFDRYEELAKTCPAEYPDGGSADQSEWMGWIFSSYRAFQWDLQTCRDVLSCFVSGLFPLRPLVDAGIVVLVSQAHIILTKTRDIVSAAMTDAEDSEFAKLCDTHSDEFPPLWDNVRGGQLMPGGESSEQKLAVLSWARAKEAAYHIRKNLVIAGDCGGIYVPENKTDYALLNHILKMAGKRIGYDNLESRIAQDIGKLSIPSLEGLPLTELIAVRKDEVAFNDFRLWLARRLVSADTSSEAGLIDLTCQEAESEIAKLRSQLSASNVIKESLRKDGLIIVVSTLVGLVAGGGLGTSVGGGIAVGLAGVLSSLRQGQQPAGTFATLARMNRVAPDGTYGKTGIIPRAPLALSTGFLGEFRTGPKPTASTEPIVYTPQRLRKAAQARLKPNDTGSPFRAIPA